MTQLIQHNLFFSALLLVIANATLSAGSPSPNTLETSLSSGTTDTQLLYCTTQFSGDYYGFGVRLGVYFAWLSSYFANILLPSEILGSLDTNSIFLLALLASLFHGTVAGQITKIDGLVIMQLSSGFLFSSFS